MDRILRRDRLALRDACPDLDPVGALEAERRAPLLEAVRARAHEDDGTRLGLLDRGGRDRDAGTAEIGGDLDGDEHVRSQDPVRIGDLDPGGRRVGRRVDGGVHRAHPALEARMVRDRRLDRGRIARLHGGDVASVEVGQHLDLRGVGLRAFALPAAPSKRLGTEPRRRLGGLSCRRGDRGGMAVRGDRAVLPYGRRDRDHAHGAARDLDPRRDAAATRTCRRMERAKHETRGSQRVGPERLMVPRDGVEPPTLRFSVACSTN